MDTTATSDARPPAAAGAGALLAHAAARFDELAAAHPRSVVRLQCRFAGMPARVAAFGSSFRVPLSALAHLVCDPPPAGAAALRIDLWEEPDAALGRSLGGDLFTERWTVGDSELLASADRRLIGHRVGAFTAVLDRRAAWIAGWLAPGDRLPAAEQGRPLFRLLAMWLGDHGRHVVHAGMVAWHGRGALIAGGGGAGKSTTVAACACAGLSYLGDDAIALERLSEGGFVGHSVFGSALLEPAMLARLPSLAAGVATSTAAADGKRLVVLARALPDAPAGAAPVAAIVLPRVRGGERSDHAPVRPAEALRALAPSTLAKRFGRGRDVLAQLARLVEHVPCYRLDVGSDLDEVAASVRAILVDAEKRS